MFRKRMKYIVLFFLIIGSCYNSFPQAQTRRLPTSINHPAINLYSPFISADGNAIVFISDNAEDAVLTPFITTRETSDWKTPQTLPKSIHSRLSFLRGYALNADGKKFFFSTVKAPSVGGYDLFWSEWKGFSWTEPVNFAKPVNSPQHEACPSFTPDERVMFFMRCEKMEQDRAEQCRIFSVVKKPNGQWAEPLELPSNINTGNSQSPRIMADGETLIFSSDKLSPSKGGMDLYMTKKKGTSQWTDPVPLDFVNTEKDDQYVSVTAVGRYLLKDAPGAKKNELVEVLIPDGLRPMGLMKIDGQISDPSGAFIESYISVTDVRTGKQVYNGRPNRDGNFIVYLKEGSRYELAIDPEKDNVTFYSRIFDLTTDKIPQGEKISVKLKPAAPGDEIELNNVTFRDYSSGLDNNSGAGLERLYRILSANTSLKADLQVFFTGYEEDSIQSSPDLTEVVYDSIPSQYDEIDSLGNLYKADTILVKTTFHNNRTLNQASAIAAYFTSKGLDPSRFTFSGKAQPSALPGEKRTVVKVVLR